MPESEPHLAIQFLGLHYRQVHGHISEHMGAKGITVMEVMDTRPSHAAICDLPTLSTTDNNPAATSSKDTRSKDTCSENTRSKDTCAKDICFEDTRSEDTCSSKQRMAKGDYKHLMMEPSSQQGDAIPAPPSSPDPEDNSQPVPIPSPY